MVKSGAIISLTWHYLAWEEKALYTPYDFNIGMVPNSVADAVKPADYFPRVLGSEGSLTHESRKYTQGTIGTIDNMISFARHSVFIFLGNGEYVSDNLAESLKQRPELDVTLVFGPYLNASVCRTEQGDWYLGFALIDDLESKRIKRYMRNTRTYDPNLVIVDGGREIYAFPSFYSQTRVLESGVLDHRGQILAESVPIFKGEVEPVRLSDGKIEDLINLYPDFNEFTRERIDEVVEKERMRKRIEQSLPGERIF